MIYHLPCFVLPLPTDCDGIPAPRWPCCCCGVAGTEPPGDEGGEQIPLEPRVSRMVSSELHEVPAGFLVCRSEAVGLWGSHNHKGVVFCVRITPRKVDMVPAEAPRADAPTEPGIQSNLTLSRRGTRTSFTFRKIRHEPCHCGECCKRRNLPLTPFTTLLQHSDSFFEGNMGASC